MKKALCCFLVSALLLTLSVFPVSAAENTGSCGDNATWSFDSSTGTLTVSGTGVVTGEAMQSSNGFGAHRASIRHLVIEEGITAISSPGFPRLYRLESLKLPDSVKSLGDGVFTQCDALVDVDLGNGVTTINRLAFNSCFALKKISLPSSVRDIGPESFSDSSISAIAIPDGVTAINNGTFRSADLEKVYIPASVTTIGYAAFRGNENLTDVYYGGTQAQWEAMDIDRNNDDPYRGNNEHLLNANIHYEHSHSYDSGTVTRHATCKQKGVKTYACIDCGAAKQETFSGSHAWDNGEMTPATCTKDGSTLYTCIHCQTTTQDTIDALGHSWDAGTTNADTTVTYKCTTCKTTKTEGTPVANTQTETDVPETTVPGVTVPAAAIPGETTPTSDISAVATEPPVTDTENATTQNNSPWIWIGVGAVVLLAAAAAVVVFLKKRK